MELLAPAGSYQIAKSVLNAGADAVYLGGQLYNARIFAGNLLSDEFCDILDYAHLFEKKIYLTLNTLHLENEMGEGLLEYIRPFYEHGLDGAIVQDFGIIRFLKKNFPNLPLHASTQMTIASHYGASGLYELGFKRVVLPRELSLAEIREIHDKTPIELEVFVHGALCYCYSGQCLMSSFLGGRSGNRGACAQPCRLPYEVCDENERRIDTAGPYVLSLKDNNASKLLKNLRDAGVASLKIEGRMKQEEYAVGVVRVYRELLDELEGICGSDEIFGSDRIYGNDRPGGGLSYVNHSDTLEALGQRSGFTDAYLRGKKGPSMVTFASPSHEKKDLPYERPADMKIKTDVEIVLKKNRPASLTLSARDVSYTAVGQKVDAARNRALTREDVKDKALAFGGTHFTAGNVMLDMDDDIFYPAGALKELRREAVAGLLAAMTNGGYAS